MGDRQVGPPLHGRREQIVGLRIVVAQELERAVGEDDPEAERRVRRVLLDDPDGVVRPLAVQQVGQVQAGWAGAHDQRAHAGANLRTG